MNKTDTHFYDSKLSVDIKEVKSDLKQIEFKKLYILVKEHKHLDDNLKSFALKAISIIIDDINSTANYSASDLKRADDILYNLCIKIFSDTDQNSIVKNLAEQLSDMILSGNCPAGRVNRLYQLYIAFVKV